MKPNIAPSEFIERIARGESAERCDHRSRNNRYCIRFTLLPIALGFNQDLSPRCHINSTDPNFVVVVVYLLFGSPNTLDYVQSPSHF
jgi:hypothetical protein